MYEDVVWSLRKIIKDHKKIYGGSTEESIIIEQAADAIEKLSKRTSAEEMRYCQFNLEEARRRESVYKCSACGNFLTVRSDTLNAGRGDLNYCPFCGRKVKHGGINE